ncbi:perlucin-like protein [Chanos chanos]|uniref:Perlucin-like protein n=1 Tax=Chanos chanos TaxID=29144 RepID=A0A6J2VT05_CHACN|nr:perlucin-like protein [Chanos chanos]
MEVASDKSVCLNHKRNVNLTPVQDPPKEKTLEKELEDVKNCATGWKYHSGKCYYLSSDEKNWTESRDSCVSMGGHLVIINSAEEQSFLKQAMPTQGWEEYWIGLTDSVNETDWRWLDNTPLSQTPKYWNEEQFDNWPGNNNEHPEGEDCAHLILSLNHYSLMDAFCEGKELKRVCEAIAVK